MSIHIFKPINSRNCLGRNDNPNPVEFASAFKKLLVCHPLTTSVGHNVLTNATGILTVSSYKKNRTLPQVVENQLMEIEVDYDITMITEIEASDPYEQHMWAYAALCVEEKFIKNSKSHKYKCDECGGILLSGNDKINDELLAMKDRDVGQIQQPSQSTLRVIIFSNAIMKIYSIEHQSGIQYSVDSIYKSVIKNIDIDDLYNDCDFSHRGYEEFPHHHKVEFINLIVQTFMTFKSHKICRKITEAQQGELIRYERKRAVILRGQ